VERILVGEKFVDIPKGLFLIRGENVVMLGEVVSRSRLGSESVHELLTDTLTLRSLLPYPCPLIQDLDADPPPQLATISPEAIPELVKSHEAEQALRRKREVRKAEVMKTQKGFCEEGAEGDNY
jgi:U6 snRNA-associated Sm-like protein LSm1